MINYKIDTLTNPEIFSSNIYLVKSELGNIVIDPSFFNSNLQSSLKQIDNLDGILITHGHGDHIRSIDDVASLFSQVPVYIHKEDSELLTNVELNCARRVGDYDIIIKSKNIKQIEEGEIQVGKYSIQVFHFQGHTYGSVMYYFKDLNIMFLGDTIMPDTVGTVRVPTGNIELLKQSIIKFKNLPINDDTICYPGHGNSAIFSEIKKNNPFLQRDYF